MYTLSLMHYAQLVIYTASYSNERTRSIQYKYYRGEKKAVEPLLLEYTDD